MCALFGYGGLNPVRSSSEWHGLISRSQHQESLTWEIEPYSKSFGAHVRSGRAQGESSDSIIRCLRYRGLQFENGQACTRSPHTIYRFVKIKGFNSRSTEECITPPGLVQPTDGILAVILNKNPGPYGCEC